MAETFSETYEQLLNDTIPQTPGIMREVAERELRLACREFFEKSWAWTQVIEDVDVSAGETDIVVVNALTPTAEVIGILNVTKSDGSGMSMLAARPNRNQTSDHPDHWFINTPPDTIRVFPYLINAQTNFLDITVALQPLPTGTALPDEAKSKFHDALVNGYLARVYMHPNKPYSAPALAGQMRASFLRSIGYYMGLRKTGGAGGQGWTYPAGWGVRRLG